MFKVGQKVVCINDSGLNINTPRIKAGEIYTCMGPNTFFSNQMQVLELGIGDDGANYWSCYYTRFRPIDFSFGEKLAEEIQEEINQEQLVNA